MEKDKPPFASTIIGAVAGDDVFLFQYIQYSTTTATEARLKLPESYASRINLAGAVFKEAAD
jgi:hypothetical protein